MVEISTKSRSFQLDDVRGIGACRKQNVSEGSVVSLMQRSGAGARRADSASSRRYEYLARSAIGTRKIRRCSEISTSIDSNRLFITDFTVYSMGIIMTRLGRSDVFDRFVQDTITDSGVDVIRISMNEMSTISAITKQYGLDFDSAASALRDLDSANIVKLKTSTFCRTFHR